MPHSPQYKAAGLSILRYVYETCELHGVDKAEIAPLLEDLRDAVLIGQHGGDLPCHEHRTRGRYLPDAKIKEIERLHNQGLNRYAIAQTLGIDYRTAIRYCDQLDANLHVAETPPPVLPNSNGATDRRADDQEPPKV